MRRRELIAAIAAASSCPMSARAQPARMPLVGFLSGRTHDGDAPYLPETLRGLRQGGFVDGRSVTLVERWADGSYDKVPVIAADLIGRGAAVLLVVGTAAANAVKQLTKTVPIVFGTADDPIAAGLVDSINRPGGNATG